MKQVTSVLALSSQSYEGDSHLTGIHHHSNPGCKSHLLPTYVQDKKINKKTNSITPPPLTKLFGKLHNFLKIPCGWVERWALV